MSASREKRVRNEERAQGGGSSKKMNSEQRDSIIFKRVCIILAVIVVLGVLVLASFGQGLPQQYITAAVVEGENISVAEMNFSYTTEVSYFLQQYASILMQIGLDFSKPLSSQPYSDTQTFGEYFQNMTLDSVKTTVLWSKLAKEEGITLTAEDQTAIDKHLDSIRTAAASAGQSVNKYISNSYGRGVTEKNIRLFFERSYLSQRYTTYHRDVFTYTGSDIQTHYDENKQTFDRVDYRQFVVTKETPEDTEGTEEDEAAEPMINTPLGEMTALDKASYDIAQSLASNAALTKETFNELAGELAPEDAKENYSDSDYTLSTNTAYSESDLMDWLFDPARVVDEVTVLDTGTSFITVMFLDRHKEEGGTVTLRHILIQPTSASSGTYTDEEWNAALTRAEGLYKSLESADEETFGKLAGENSDDTNSTDAGGLRKEISNTYFTSSEINNWLFDNTRKSGDITLIQDSSAYHILYYVQAGRPLWEVNVESAMRSADATEFFNEKELNSGNPIPSEFGMSLVTEV